MSVEDLSEVLEDANTAEGAQFIDVREPHEEEIAALPRFHLMPLSRCAGRLRCIKCSMYVVGNSALLLCFHLMLPSQ